MLGQPLSNQVTATDVGSTPLEPSHCNRCAATDVGSTPLSSADARPGGGHRFEAHENASFGLDSSAQSAYEPLVHPGFPAGAAAAAGEEQEIRLSGDGLENLFYSLSLFFMWTSSYSIMSIHKDLGPLVIIIRRMAFDMLNFAVVWMVLLMAFSCLLQGFDLLHPPSAPTSTNSTNTFKEEGGEGARGHYMGDWSSWWIWRTYYQAMGQPFFDEMPSGYSNAATIFIWLIMNVMMVNLLVAMMSDTYAQVKNHSRLEWMIEMLHTARRYRSPSRLNVLLLLRDACNFVMQRRHIKRIMSDYMSEGHHGIPHLSVHRDVAAPLRGLQERGFSCANTGRTCVLNSTSLSAGICHAWTSPLNYSTLKLVSPRCCFD